MPRPMENIHIAQEMLLQLRTRNWDAPLKTRGEAGKRCGSFIMMEFHPKVSYTQ